MNRQEIITCITSLGVASPKFGQWVKSLSYVETEAMIRTWLSCLGDIPAEVADKGISRLLVESPYPPSIHELRKACVSCVSKYPTATEAYLEAMDTMRRPLPQNFVPEEDEARLRIERCSPLTQRVLWGIGWEEFCREDLGVMRGQFLRMYEAQVKREEAETLLPQHLRNVLPDRRMPALTQPAEK